MHRMIENQFIEVLIAPDFDDASLKILSKKPNIRALVGKEIASDQEEMKFITGVVLNQKTDNADFSNMDLKTVTEIKPSKSELEDLNHL